MLQPVFKDLVKPQWRLALETLKQTGGLTIRELAETLKCSYMAAKSHCEHLTKHGYLKRSRIPRTEVGRPEIFYSIGPKADTLFPQAGDDFALAMLEECQLMFGEMAPDKLLFQHFTKLGERWAKELNKSTTLLHRAAKLCLLRNKLGGSSTCENDDTHSRIVEVHNPLHRILEKYPRAITMEQRAIEQALGTSVSRSERAHTEKTPHMVVFEFRHAE